MGKLAKIIAFEGGDGTGKSSCARLMADVMREQGFKCHVFPIIETSAVGKIYKQNYLFNGTSPVREAAGMLTSVLDTLETVIKPSRQLYDFIVLDRTLASFATYQLLTNNYHWAKPMFEEALRNEDFTDYTTIYLEVNPEEALRRMSAGRDVLDLVEKRGPQYQRLIQAAYEHTFTQYPVLAPSLRVDTNTANLDEIKVLLSQWVKTFADQHGIESTNRRIVNQSILDKGPMAGAWLR